MSAMPLPQLLTGVIDAACVPDLRVTGMTLDSRAVREGDAFVALRGTRQHGMAFAADAAARGACVVLAETDPASGFAADDEDSLSPVADAIGANSLPPRAGEDAHERTTAKPLPPRAGEDAEGRWGHASGRWAHASTASGQAADGKDHTANEATPAAGASNRDQENAQPESTAIPTLWIDDLRHHLGTLAARFYGNPSRRMTVIGVTGTNGKTSVVQMLAQALSHLGQRCASIGTLGAGMHGALEAGERTTPDVIKVQALLADFAAHGATHVAMEVSSHALDQRRVDGVAFDLALFTNLSRDHLDYHGSMEAYGAAKERLFACATLKSAVINVDDVFGHGLAARVPTPLKRLRVSLGAPQAEIRAANVRAHAGGLSLRLCTPWGEADVESMLLGRFNVSNLLMVAAALGALGTPFDAIVAALAVVQPVPGRMSRLGGTNGRPLVVVDYAHTPDALQQALQSVRAHCSGRVICVFGCGGERDAGKRPQMGAIAERVADSAVVTDDNPRGEDGDAIVTQILDGMRHPESVHVERDRAAAIAWACNHAGAGDAVLIAGKGHEATQDIAGVKRPFDDLAVARAQLEVCA